jgi:hypothetical protein
VTTPTPPEGQEQLDQFVVHAAELYALEQAARAAVAGPLRKQLAAIHRALSVTWLTRFGSLNAAADPVTLRQVVTQVKEDLATVDSAVADRLTDYANRALATGVQHAADEAHVTTVIQAGGRTFTGDDLENPPSSKRPPATPAPPASRQRARAEPRRAQRVTRIDWPTQEAIDAQPRRPRRAVRRHWPTIDVDPVLDDTTQRVIDTLDAEVQQRLRHAADALDRVAGDTFTDVSNALTESQKAVTVAEQATTYAINAASTAGIKAVANGIPDENVQLVWVAERNACVHCLAYAGQVVTMHESFPIGLTFGKKPLVPWPDPQWLSGPPLHPNCRCRLSVWLGHAEGAPGPTLPEVLKREAQRSILRGWRTDTEPESVRVAAAARLLARGVNSPKSVKDYARRAIRKGRFPDHAFPESRS